MPTCDTCGGPTGAVTASGVILCENREDCLWQTIAVTETQLETFVQAVEFLTRAKLEDAAQNLAALETVRRFGLRVAGELRRKR